MKYRRKDSDVEAIQWTGKNLAEVREFLGNDLKPMTWGNQYTFNGIMSFMSAGITCFAQTGDWIVRGEWLEAMSESNFRKRYEAVS